MGDRVHLPHGCKSYWTTNVDKMSLSLDIDNPLKFYSQLFLRLIGITFTKFHKYKHSSFGTFPYVHISFVAMVEANYILRLECLWLVYFISHRITYLFNQWKNCLKEITNTSDVGLEKIQLQYTLFKSWTSIHKFGNMPLMKDWYLFY